MAATKRQIIADNNLNSVADVYSLLKDSFKDILQELMEGSYIWKLRDELEKALWQADLSNVALYAHLDEKGELLILRIKELNEKIIRDKSLGKGFCIGHSYFCNASECTKDWMKEVVDYDILPMLREYWFDNPDELQRWENILQGVFQ